MPFEPPLRPGQMYLRGALLMLAALVATAGVFCAIGYFAGVRDGSAPYTKGIK